MTGNTINSGRTIVEITLGMYNKCIIFFLYVPFLYYIATLWYTNAELCSDAYHVYAFHLLSEHMLSRNIYQSLPNPHCCLASHTLFAVQVYSLRQAVCSHQEESSAKG